MKNFFLKICCFIIVSCHSFIKTEDYCFRFQCKKPLVKSIVKNNSQRLLISSKALLLNRVVRDYTELREGPRSTFKIKGSYIRKNTPAIILKKSDYWTKVYLPTSQQSGWVHADTLKIIRSHKPDFIEIPVKHLSSVFSKEQEVTTYLRNRKPFKKILLKPDDRLYSLREDKFFTLIWNPRLNQSMWMKNSSLN